ncbi:hypothetical protein QAD02_022761 [Eretmocerus hayati]|uniref:Uncharacterized protein n=1 Tax=Eretmocerus hayati TaxID=131215 RepID=A0ACC2PX94_9HYME|nr:hypothetical protein QAD02_022761 [Eretmocerus hayati]
MLGLLFAGTIRSRLTVPGSQHHQQQQEANTSASSSPTGQPRRSIVRVGTMRLGGGSSTNQQQHYCCSVNRVNRETKTAGTLAAVVGGFVACWLPFFILYLATPFMPVEPPGPLMPALTWLGWMNSAMNPFIYAFYSADFRLAFWRLTCRHCWRGRFDSMNIAGPGGATYGAGLSAGGPGGPNSQAANWRRQTSRA